MKSIENLSYWLSLLFMICNVLSCKSPTENAVESYHFSFENDYECWTVRALDVTMNLPDTTMTIPWHIIQSNLRATHGSKSLEFYFHNATDAAKIWIERSFQLDPAKSYAVTITYDFASADGGAAGGQTLVTKIVSASPQSSADIIAGTLPGGTYNGGGFEYRWLAKQINTTIQPHSSGHIVVFIGIWGTFEIASTYYIDNVRVLINPG